LLGFGSVWYWHYTEQLGMGDLRPYYLVQFGAIAAVMMMTVMFPPRYTGTRTELEMFVLYTTAKVQHMKTMIMLIV